MKKPLLLAGIAISMLLLSPVISQAQILNWLSSFTPSWVSNTTTGSATNVNGTGINTSVAITKTGGAYTYANGISGTMSPTVSGATATVPGSPTRMQIGMDFASDANTVTVVYTFSSQVTNVNFRIADIDKLSATSFSYVDKITVTGAKGASTFTPTITKYDAVTDPNFLIISGNTVNANPASGQGGNAASDATDQRGTVNVNFGTASLTSLTIVYGNESSAQANPGVQFVAIGNLSFISSTLPVILSDFTGHRRSQDVVLDWKTQQEFNSRSFDIERSTTGSNWQKIASVSAAGNTANVSNYTYTDNNPQGSLLLYRLKQNDIDDNYKYSGVIRIMGKDVKTTFGTYPNPFTEQVNINVNSPTDQRVSATIIDALGKTIRSETKNIYTGNNNFTITGLSGLARGIYYASLKDENGTVLGQTKLVRN